MRRQLRELVRQRLTRSHSESTALEAADDIAEISGSSAMRLDSSRIRQERVANVAAPIQHSFGNLP